MTEISLYQRLNKKKFIPEKVAEVGVYYPETSLIYEYILNGTPTILVEADPGIANLIRSHFHGNNNYSLYEVAIYDSECDIELVRSGASSFIADLNSSPAKVNDGINIKNLNKIKVKATTFDKIDDSHIDLLAIDIEGCEWYVLKYMKSRPAVISIETHGGLYKNPFYDNIKKWMNDNDYEIWYKTKSDSVFVKRHKIKIDIKDKTLLFLTDILIFIIKLKKVITKIIKGLF
mgnify:CR=1 FL=1